MNEEELKAFDEACTLGRQLCNDNIEKQGADLAVTHVSQGMVLAATAFQAGAMEVIHQILIADDPIAKCRELQEQLK